MQWEFDGEQFCYVALRSCVASQRSFAMVERQQHAPWGVYALADHLDTVLAAVEDLLRLHAGYSDASTRLRLELVAITHVLQARQRTRELEFTDLALAGRSMLFLSGTEAFETGNPESDQSVADTLINERYLIGQRIPLNVLRELASAMLDGLESSYVLYAQEEHQATHPGDHLPPVSGIWSSTTAIA
jgi:hypothetical protein